MSFWEWWVLGFFVMAGPIGFVLGRLALKGRIKRDSTEDHAESYEQGYRLGRLKGQTEVLTQRNDVSQAMLEVIRSYTAEGVIKTPEKMTTASDGAAIDTQQRT